MRRQLLGIASFAATFIALDALWLSQAGPRLYKPALGPLLVDRPRAAPALAFYAIYISSAYAFCAARAGSAWTAARRGAAFGLAAYATYDLTNQAVLTVWPLRLTLVDLGWGAGLTALASSLAASVRGTRRREGARP